MTSGLIRELQSVLDHNWSGRGLVPSEIRSLLDHIASLEAALAPFAKEAVEENGEPRHDWKFAPDNELIPGFCDLTYGDFRRAARASTPLDGERPRRPLTSHARTSPGPINCNLRLKMQGHEIEPECERCRGTCAGDCPFFFVDGQARDVPLDGEGR